MKKNSIEDILNSLNECLGSDNIKTYDLWYKTKVKNIKRHKIFQSINEGRIWIDKNKNNVIPMSGSWQLLEMFA